MNRTKWGLFGAVPTASGSRPARIRTGGPAANGVRGLLAGFNPAFALRHITLHRLPGNLLNGVRRNA